MSKVLTETLHGQNCFICHKENRIHKNLEFTNDSIYIEHSIKDWASITSWTIETYNGYETSWKRHFKMLDSKYQYVNTFYI